MKKSSFIHETLATMVLMKYFCFCFPIRISVLITSSVVILENLLILGVVLMYNEEDLKLKAEKFQEMKKDLSTTEQLDTFLDFVAKSKVISKIKSKQSKLISIL